MLQLILAMMMATSGCLCSAICGVSLCEHDHHAGEYTCADHEHQHQEPEDCDHPEPADRSLPDPPTLLASFVPVMDVFVQDWPREITASQRIKPPSPEAQVIRRREFRAILCRFLL
jgi:hypothetical protein